MSSWYGRYPNEGDIKFAEARTLYRRGSSSRYSVDWNSHATPKAVWGAAGHRSSRWEAASFVSFLSWALWPWEGTEIRRWTNPGRDCVRGKCVYDKKKVAPLIFPNAENIKWGNWGSGPSMDWHLSSHKFSDRWTTAKWNHLLAKLLIKRYSCNGCTTW